LILPPGVTSIAGSVAIAFINRAFPRSDFVFDAERNRYICPQGKLLVQFRRTYATPRSGKDGTRLCQSPICATVHYRELRVRGKRIWLGLLLLVGELVAAEG
jgi:hypothetical protein